MERQFNMQEDIELIRLEIVRIGLAALGGAWVTKRDALPLSYLGVRNHKHDVQKKPFNLRVESCFGIVGDQVSMVRCSANRRL